MTSRSLRSFQPARLTRVLALLGLIALLPAQPALAQSELTAAQETASKLWIAFAHKTLVGQPDLAKEAGDQLVADGVQRSDLLDAVEASEYTDIDPVMDRATRMEGLAETAKALETKILLAKLDRAEEPQRIAADIEALGQSQRQRFNATRRLAAAGQLAAPPLLRALQAKGAQADSLRPYVVEAMTQIGRPLVYPLAVALPTLSAQDSLLVLGVLEDIGYPEAAPYIAQALESGSLDQTASAVASQTLSTLVPRLGAPADADAATLHLIQAEKLYASAGSDDVLPGAIPLKDVGLIWTAEPNTGLIRTAVPLSVYPMRRAMQAAEAALTLSPASPGSDAPMSLYLAANLARENALDGAADPSYDGKPASFYAMIAGPLRLHEVLTRALATSDTELALDAIDGLAKTSGTDVLLNLGAENQPLLSALSYPDAVVRRRSAMVLASSNPQSPFPGSFQVVPTLGEAVRQSEQRYALLVSADSETAALIRSPLESAGYTVLNGVSIVNALDTVSSVPAVDLMVLNNVTDADAELAEAAQQPKLAASPVVIFADAATEIRLTNRFTGNPRVLVAAAVNSSDDAERIGEAASLVSSNFSGTEIDPAMAEAMALEALSILDGVVLDSPVYQIASIEGILIEALNDSREAIAIASGGVLAKVNTPTAQQALADAGINGFDEQQIAMLQALAKSAKAFGSSVTSAQAEALGELVASAEGDTALAAAEAHGALALPTEAAVELLLGE